MNTLVHLPAPILEYDPSRHQRDSLEAIFEDRRESAESERTTLVRSYFSPNARLDIDAYQAYLAKLQESVLVIGRTAVSHDSRLQSRKPEVREATLVNIAMGSVLTYERKARIITAEEMHANKSPSQSRRRSAKFVTSNGPIAQLSSRAGLHVERLDELETTEPLFTGFDLVTIGSSLIKHARAGRCIDIELGVSKTLATAIGKQVSEESAIVHSLQ